MWAVEFHRKAFEELYELPDSLTAKFLEMFENIESNGFDAIPPKNVKNVEDGIREFRVKGKDGIAEFMKKPGFAEAREQARREFEEDIAKYGTIGNPKPQPRPVFARASTKRKPRGVPAHPTRARAIA